MTCLTAIFNGLFATTFPHISATLTGNFAGTPQNHSPGTSDPVILMGDSTHEEGSPVRIALFSTCLADVMFPQAAQATVTLLERLGHEVVFPEARCAADRCTPTPATSKTQPRSPATMSRPSSPCSTANGTPSSSPPLLHRCSAPRTEVVAEHVGDHELAKKSQLIAQHTYDLTELITDVLGLEDRGRPTSPTPSPTTRPATRCVSPGRRRPYRLLRAVEGLTLRRPCPTPRSAAVSAAPSP